MKKDSNRGIIVTGGHFTAGAVAIGNKAVATIDQVDGQKEAIQKSGEAGKPTVNPTPIASPAKAVFDVFLSHNSSDKPAVRQLKRQLVSLGLSVWLDEDELRPGLSWQQLLEIGVRNSLSVAVLMGKDGLGPWENEEMQAALTIAVRAKRPVIPVLLAGAPDTPDLPIFLANRTWVDLREGFSQTGMGRLVWGITGDRREL